MQGHDAVPLNGNGPAVQIPIPQMAHALYKHTDGSFWFQTIVTLGPTQFNYALPMDIMDNYMSEYRNAYGKIKADWRRARTGLLLPPNATGVPDIVAQAAESLNAAAADFGDDG